VKSNTSEHIPYDCIAAIMIESVEFPAYPFFSGTGFYALFPPRNEIYLITARHCIYDGGGELKGKVKVSLRMDGVCKKALVFDAILETKYLHDQTDFEDVAVLVVGDMASEDKELLRNRALKLPHQEDAERIIDLIQEKNGKIRTVGFPGVSKKINYESNTALMRPRGFYGKIEGKAGCKNWFKFKPENWTDGELSGFSGSPMLELLLTPDGRVLPTPIGVIVTEANFIAINVATDLIAEYIKSELLAQS